MIGLLFAAALQASSTASPPTATPQTAPLPTGGQSGSTAPMLGPIGKQVMPAKGCAAFLWGTTDRTLVAMAGAETGRIRVAIDGKPIDYLRANESGAGGFGFAGVTTYRGGDLTIALDMTIVSRDDLASGAMIPAATLRIDRPGRDTVILPVAGMVGCA